MGKKGSTASQSKTYCLVLPLGPQEDALGPLKGLLVHPLENTRTLNLTHPLARHAQAPGLSPEGANPEAVGIPLQRPG